MIYLEINGTPLDGFTNVSVTRQYQSVPAQFSFNATVSPSDLTKFPVQIGDKCRVLVGESVYCDGFVDEIAPRHNNNSHEIAVRGASKVVDLCESTMDGGYDVKGPITLKAALEQIIEKSGCDIKVFDETDGRQSFEQDEIIAGDIGSSMWSLMLKCALKKNVLLTETANGDVLITLGSGTRINTTLKKQQDGLYNNIMASSMRRSLAQRFNEYKVLSQGDTLSLQNTSDTTDTTTTDMFGQVYDDNVRETRKKAFVAETSSNMVQCLERAIWQANYQRVQSFDYSCTVQGFYYDTGELIEPGQVVNVIDVYMTISSDLIIDSVTFSYTEDGGSKTRIKMLLPDAFTLIAIEPSYDETGNETTGVYS